MAVVITWPDPFQYDFSGGPGPYLPERRVYPVPVNNPPVSTANIIQVEIATTAARPDPALYTFIGGQSPFVPRQVAPGFEAVRVDNPPLIKLIRPLDTWWIPSDPSPTLQPRVTRGPPVNNPPFGLPPISAAAILTSWQPPGPQAPAAGKLNAVLLAVSVNPPPFGIPPLSQRSILDAWQPPPAQAPVAGALNPAFCAVPANNPPFGIPPKSQATILAAWIPPDAQAPVAQKLSPAFEAVPANSPSPTSSANNQLAGGGAWPALPDPLPILPRYLPAAITSVPVNNPPFDIPQPWLRGALEAWVPPPPQPIVASVFNPAPLVAPPSNPPFAVRGWLGAVLAAWTPPDAQAPTAQPLTPVLEALPVNNPPFGGAFASTPSLGDVLPSWASPDPAPILAPAWPQAPVAFVSQTLAWLPGVLGAWISDQPQAVLARPLNPAFLAVAVNNPPISAAKANAIFAPWLPVEPLAILPRAFAQAAPGQIALGNLANSSVILGAWVAGADPTVVARNLNPVLLAVRVDAPPPLSVFMPPAMDAVNYIPTRTFVPQIGVPAPPIIPSSPGVIGPAPGFNPSLNLFPPTTPLPAATPSVIAGSAGAQINPSNSLSPSPSPMPMASTPAGGGSAGAQINPSNILFPPKQ